MTSDSPKQEPPKWEQGRPHWIVGTLIALGGLGVAATGLIVHFNDGSSKAEAVAPTQARATTPAPQSSTEAHPDGWGPDRETFTQEVPASYAVLNSITNNPAVGDERNFTRVRLTDSNGPYDDMVRAEVGDTVSFNVIVVNDCADNLASSSSALHGLWIKFIPQTTGRDLVYTGFVGANNAMTVWDGASVLVNQDAHLEIVPGSARMVTQTVDPPGFQVDSGALERGDQVSIGEDRADGEYPVGHLPARPNASLGFGWVEFQAKVVAGA